MMPPRRIITIVQSTETLSLPASPLKMIRVSQRHWHHKSVALSTKLWSPRHNHHQRVSHPSSVSLSSSSSSTATSPGTIGNSVTPPPSPPPAIGVLGTLFFGSLCAGTFFLGTWQMQRYFDKTKLIPQRNHELQAPPVTFQEYCCEIQQQQQSTSKSTTTTAAFRKIRLVGRYHHEYELLVGPRGAPPSSKNDDPGGMAVSPQGYYVVTPLEILAGEAVKGEGQGEGEDQQGHHNTKESQYVLINRGWVPRHMVFGSSNQQQQQHQQQRRPTAAATTTATSAEEVMAWDRTTEVTQVTVIPTQGEAPRFLVAQHNFSHQPAIFFWYDIRTMMEVALPNYVDSRTNHHNTDDDKNALSRPQEQQRKKQIMTLPYATQVSDDHDVGSTSEWPVSPTADHLADFKTSPSIHLGYAFTWYGLSMAGLYMTRLLLFKR